MKKIKKVNMDGLKDSQKKMLSKHSKHHTIKHMQEMIALMRQGKTFKQSHNIAMDKVGM